MRGHTCNISRTEPASLDRAFESLLRAARSTHLFADAIDSIKVCLVRRDESGKLVVTRLSVHELNLHPSFEAHDFVAVDFDSTRLGGWAFHATAQDRGMGGIRSFHFDHYRNWDSSHPIGGLGDGVNHMIFQQAAASVYYMTRCLARAFSARSVYATPNASAGGRFKYNLYFWRPGRKSLVIPQFEEYCEQVGYACMEDADGPVTPVPDYIPTGPLHYELQKLEDWR